MSVLLEARGLVQQYTTGKSLFGRPGAVRAVDGIDLSVAEGEILGVVGESGSGKSVSSMAVMGLLPSNARVTGGIRLRGESLLDKDDRELSRLRGREVAIYQFNKHVRSYVINPEIDLTVRFHNARTNEMKEKERMLRTLHLFSVC